MILSSIEALRNTHLFFRSFAVLTRKAIAIPYNLHSATLIMVKTYAILLIASAEAAAFVPELTSVRPAFPKFNTHRIHLYGEEFIVGADGKPFSPHGSENRISDIQIPEEAKQYLNYF